MATKPAPKPAAKSAPAGKLTLQQALKQYQGSPADNAADLAAAKKLMAAHNSKVK